MPTTMAVPRRLRQRLLVTAFALGMVGLPGCSSEGTVTVENDGSTVVTVAFADVDLGEVEADGGALVNTDDCLKGPVVVTFKSGRVVELAEAACPGQRLSVREDSAELVAQRDR